MRHTLLAPALLLFSCSLLWGQEKSPIKVVRADDHIAIETDQVKAKVRTKGYVSGIADASFVDNKTGAKDIGFGLHIMDFLLAPGWRDDKYTRDRKYHGDLPKHYDHRKNRS